MGEGAQPSRLAPSFNTGLGGQCRVLPVSLWVGSVVYEGWSDGGVTSRGNSSPYHPSLLLNCFQESSWRLQGQSFSTADRASGTGAQGQERECGEHCFRDTPLFSLSHTEGRRARVFTSSEFQVIIVRMLLEI